MKKIYWTAAVLLLMINIAAAAGCRRLDEGVPGSAAEAETPGPSAEPEASGLAAKPEAPEPSAEPEASGAAAAGAIGGGTAGAPADGGGELRLEEPPLLTVYGQETELPCRAGTYEWYYPEQGDEWVGIAADSAHPLDYEFTESVYSGEADGEAKLRLVFAVPPEQVTVSYWDGKHRQEAEAYVTPPSAVESQASPDRPGEYLFAVPADQIRVYQVYATWEREYFYGDAYYGFLVGPREIFMDVTEADDEGITAVFQNHTDEEWSYGERYQLEVWQNSGWERLAYASGVEPAFHGIAYVITAGGVSRERYEYRLLYGTLAPGKYRIVTGVMEEVTEGRLIDTMRELKAEFVIS